VTINEAVLAIEELLAKATGVASFQARPSGDDVDVIKIWADLGDTKQDPDEWSKKFEAEIRAKIPGTAPYRLQVRAETGT
jgi:hypothetical protein